jgi:hypothetical protein
MNRLHHIGCVTMILVALLLPMSPRRVSAEPGVVARQDHRQPGATITGELRFDLGGGRVQGQVTLAVMVEGDGSPRYQNGNAAKGGFNIRIDLDGVYGGGLFGQSRGHASVSGTFVDEANCQAKVTGQGTFRGNTSGPIGIAIVVAEWTTVRFEECGLASPQRLSMALPPFTFAATEDVVMRPDAGSGSFIGCYKDPNNPSDRDGYVLLERSQSNTPQHCVQMCRDQGFAYAGVQSGESCLCGNSYAKVGEADNCTSKCTGDPSQICGGRGSNSVYTTGLGTREGRISK